MKKYVYNNTKFMGCEITAGGGVYKRDDKGSLVKVPPQEAAQVLPALRKSREADAQARAEREKRKAEHLAKNPVAVAPTESLLSAEEAA